MVFFACMRLHVSVEMSPIDKPFLAQMTHIRSLACMDPYVMNQARFSPENFGTSIALVDFGLFFSFSAVRSYVFLFQIFKLNSHIDLIFKVDFVLYNLIFGFWIVR